MVNIKDNKGRAKRIIIVLIVIIILVSITYIGVLYILERIRKDYHINNESRTIFCSDIDGDGYTDILTSDGDIFFNHGNGEFQVKKRFDGAEYGIACDDLDKDGDNDIVLARNNQNRVTLLFNDGNGYFGSELNYQLESAAHPQWIELGDINGDDYIDFIVGSHYYNYIFTFINQKNSSFKQESKIKLSQNTESFSLADIDSDDDLDIVLSSWSLWNNYTIPHTIHILENNGFGFFTNKTNFTAGLRSTSVVTADMNNDGKMDIITVNADSNSLSVFFNQDNGTLFQNKDYNINSPYVVRCADIDGKNGIDILVTTTDPYTITVLKNNGKGEFGNRKRYPIYGSVFSPYGLVISDLNNDDFPDIVALTSFLATKLSILINLGDGTYPSIEIEFYPIIGLIIISAIIIAAVASFLKAKKDMKHPEEVMKFNKELFQKAKEEGFIRFACIFIAIPMVAFFVFFIYSRVFLWPASLETAGIGLFCSLMFFGLYRFFTKFEDFFAQSLDKEGKPIGMDEVRKLKLMVLIAGFSFIAISIFTFLIFLGYF